MGERFLVFALKEGIKQNKTKNSKKKSILMWITSCNSLVYPEWSIL